ncbi:MAG: hypothetical protein PQJ46_03375 [Spirochaetales bacterium]|nr:hypothetical protein [Spirochaetales bacterium]
MSYDILGQLEEKRDRKGIVLKFEYDELGRNTAVIHYEDEASYNSNSPVRSVCTEYDKRGNAVRVHSEDLIEHYEYDCANRVTSLDRRLTDTSLRETIAEVWGGAESEQVFSFGYEYNDAGLVTRMDYPDGAIHEFSYDEQLARLTEIDEGADDASISAFVTGFDYNKSGVVTQMEWGNGTVQGWEFDNRKRISNINISNSSTTLEELEYSLDGSGDILSINKNEYEYDGFGRITGASTFVSGTKRDYISDVRESFGTYSGGDPVDGKIFNAEADIETTDGQERVNGADYLEAVELLSEDSYDIESFAYDKNGNRTELEQNGDLFVYSYGERNKLLSIKVKYDGESSYSTYAEYEYDANGNTTRRTIYGKESLQVINFSYDTLNRLVATEEQSTINGALVTTTKQSSYSYDNAGNRFVKVDGDGNTTLYLRHGQVAVAMDVEVNSDQETNKGMINRYVLSGDLLAGRVTSTIASDASVTEERFYYHLDHLNSTKMVTDEDGEIVVNYIYRAFGEQLKRLDADNLDTEDEAKYSYGGKELDYATNLYYFNARYYDATTGRFINVDPIQDGLNWYAYANNNPLKFVDPTGVWVNFAIGAGLGFVTSSVQEVVMNKDAGQSWGRAIKETFTSGKSLAVIGASTAIGALTSGTSALATQSAIGAAKTGAMLVTTQTSAQIIAKTAAINATGAAIGAATTDVVTKEIKGQSQNLSDTLSRAGKAAMVAAGASILSRGIVATQSMKISGGATDYITSETIGSKTVLPEWSTGFGITTENVLPAAESVYSGFTDVSTNVESSSGETVSSSSTADFNTVDVNKE